MINHDTTIPAGTDITISTADVVLFVRPAHAGPGHDDEQMMSWDYQEFAQWSTYSLVNHFIEIIDERGEGKYIIGVRQEGDEQYTQRFMAVSPHAEEHFLQLVENHLHGVLNHWRC